jgi:hypothetical protein
MKIITKATLYLEPGKPGIAPGEEVELDDDEAKTMIDRGLAELPPEADVEGEAAAKAETKAAAKAETEAAAKAETEAAAKAETEAAAKAETEAAAKKK